MTKTQKSWVLNLALAIGGLLIAWTAPSFWAWVVVPGCFVVFIVLTMWARHK